MRISDVLSLGGMVVNGKGEVEVKIVVEEEEEEKEEEEEGEEEKIRKGMRGFERETRKMERMRFYDL